MQSFDSFISTRINSPAFMEHSIPTPIPKDRSKKKKKSKKSQDGSDDTFDESKRNSIIGENEADSQGEESPAEEHEERSPTTLEKIQEIFNPTFKIPESKGPYRVPDAVRADDVSAMRDLDEKKIIELKELFTLLDTDADGIVSPEDLRATFRALGKDPTPQSIEQMLTEAMSPLDFDAFVALMGYKMIELDPEDVLLEAWSKWDTEGTGYVYEERIFNDLVRYGNCFSETEAREALEDAPMAKPKTLDEPPMIDYAAFCRELAGLRRRRQPD